jgi:hypothetical protein
MSRPSIDLHQKVREILGHVIPLPAEAGAPLSHYGRSSTDLWSLITYVERNFGQLPLQPAAVRRHMGRLHGMILVNLVETFERYLKEVAAACVDALARYVLDDRFNAFKVQGSALAAHFDGGTLGRSLCESATWVSCDEVNDRFRRLLAPPFEKGSFLLFPKQPPTEGERYDTLCIVWQLRHTIVHNVGVITQSDAIKLRLLVRAAVPQMQILAPTRDDIRYLKRFLDETAERSNRRIGERLAEILTALHAVDGGLFVPQQMADAVTRTFGFVLFVAGVAGTLPP